MARPNLSPAGEIVRCHDPDRFFTALFAPPERRETLFTLYAFNHELARASEVAREPVSALIRLQWWREVVEGARRRHEVAEPLGAALDAGHLLPADLLRMIDAREAEIEPVEDMAAFTDYVQDTAGTLMVAASRSLGFESPEYLRRPGAACGISTVLRNAARTAAGHSMLPRSGADPESLRQLGLQWLGPKRRHHRRGLAAVLPLALARHRLRRGPAAGGGRLAVLIAAVTGRP